MADQSSLRNRIRPSLLDLLTDDEPTKFEESYAQQVLSEADYLKTIRRDLQWLMNTTSLESYDNLDDFDPNPNNKQDPPNYLKQSVLNFGVQCFSGHTVSSLNSNIKSGDIKKLQIKERMRQAILRFEPRIATNSLKVDAQADDQFNHKALSFDIRGDLRMQPSDLPLHWKTHVDLDIGAVEIDNAD